MTKEDILQKKIEDKVKKAIWEYNLINDNDKILIGLSGGKDSLALVDLLSRRSKILQPKFSIVAAHIIMENIPYTSDIDYLQEYTKERGVPLIIHKTSFNPSTDKRKTPCFLCSWMRRKMLFNIAKEQKCNKIALGHHQDDILETLLMNLIYQGAFSTMPPSLKMNKFEMEIIRPLCLVKEEEIEKIAKWQKFKGQLKNCPYESVSNRANIKKFLSEITEINPQARHSLWASMHNIQTNYLPQKQKAEITKETQKNK